MRLLSTAGARLAMFAVALVVVFGAAYAVGNQFPDRADASTAPAVDHGQHGATAITVDESQPHAHDTASRPASTSADGYELRLDAGPDAHTLTYRVVGPDGATVTDFADNHGALLHTVLVRPDLSDFQHLHPEIQADGRWTVTVPAGPWHLVFDVWPQGAAGNVVLSTNADDEVPVPAVALPAPDDRPTVDGLVVQRDGLTFTVTNTDGSAATGLGPYLGSPAHLIVLREGDLASTHLHPAGTSVAQMPDMTMPEVTGPDGPANVFTFAGTLPAGTYRAFLQFMHDGALVTVPYTVVVS